MYEGFKVTVVSKEADKKDEILNLGASEFVLLDDAEAMKKNQ